MPTYGLTPAGFVVKPLSAILADMQTQVLATIDTNYDLSPQTPDGQMLGIVAAVAASEWEFLQVTYDAYDREAAEGAALDNLGDIIGVPREGETFTQVGCTLVFGSTAIAGTYPAGSFIANVAGNSSLVFQNANPVVLAGGAQTLTGVLFEATTAGPTPTINPGTLNVITTPVTGWTSITNPLAQSSLGLNEELDEQYGPRQEQDVSGQGSANASATAAALNELGAAQVPPVDIAATILENTTANTLVVSGVSLPPHTYAPVVYDGGSGWAAGNPQLIAGTIYKNKPGGITSFGSTSATIVDPILGNQTVSWTLPTGVPIFISATVVPRANVVFADLVTAIQTALVAAAIAPTPASGIPPFGQMVPGSPIVGSQFEAVILGVPGVFDVQALTFDTHSAPTNTAPITLIASEVGTILQATVATNIVITQGTYP